LICLCLDILQHHGQETFLDHFAKGSMETEVVKMAHRDGLTAVVEGLVLCFERSE